MRFIALKLINTYIKILFKKNEKIYFIHNL